MDRLKDNWLTEGLIDFEYKKYVLLAYLQHAKKEFGVKKLFPCFNDLIFHYQNLTSIQENKELLYENFPKKISRADFKKLKLNYEKIVTDDEVMQEIRDIIYFAIPKFKDLLENGKEIYDLIERHIDIQPVGISPLYPDEGYVFMREFNRQEVRIYQYQITLFERVNEKYRGIHTTYIDTVYQGLQQSYEFIKIELIKRFKELPNPATFSIHSRIPCPFDESFFPVARRSLVKHISHLAA
jgi:hypothetical protein